MRAVQIILRCIIDLRPDWYAVLHNKECNRLIKHCTLPKIKSEELLELSTTQSSPNTKQFDKNKIESDRGEGSGLYTKEKDKKNTRRIKCVPR